MKFHENRVDIPRFVPSLTAEPATEWLIGGIPWPSSIGIAVSIPRRSGIDQWIVDVRNWPTKSQPIEIGDEVCDGQDNDCDGLTDENFDLASDEDNCGECGVVCGFDQARPTCTEGVCGIRSCEPGWVDTNADLEDGCECRQSNDGEEICDDSDNDCDGKIDEGQRNACDLCGETPPEVCDGNSNSFLRPIPQKPWPEDIWVSPR